VADRAIGAAALADSGELGAIADRADDDLRVRESALYALSQRPRGEGIPALIRIARESREPQLRKKAVYALAQSQDPRAVALFEELLVKKD
jgi:HEAT repeat protein